MKEAHAMSRKEKPRRSGLVVFLTILMVLMIAATGVVLWMCIRLTTSSALPVPSTEPQLQLNPETTAPAPTETQTVPTTEPFVPKDPETVVATATIASMGDVMCHEPIYRHAKESDGSYNFDFIFKFAADTISSYDYAVANLETTFNGAPYSGHPHFNSPETLADAVKNGGFDMLLTANNHSYDTTLPGMKNTLEVVRATGLQTLGTMLNKDEPKYVIQEINGIKIGMLCYTFADSVTGDGRPVLNNNSAVKEKGIVNFFTYRNLDAFYSEVEGYLAEMENSGAEATMLYIHWGTEYETEASDTQKKMAQKLCDLGVDVILGGHPHVVQPIELLESSNGHRTVCIYSLGNAVSNQRIAQMDLKTGHTEDGVIFSVTFEKYSDGKVYLLGVDALPTWVNLRPVSDSKKEFNILPLKYDAVEQWKELYSLTDDTLESAKKSYSRTMDIISDGLTACKSYFGSAKTSREEYYYTLANFPERLEALNASAETTAPVTAE